MTKKLLLISVLGGVLIGNAAMLTFADSSWLRGAKKETLP
jgi:hypothetical protein